jgi:ATP synthase in type III secretion protein N
MPPQTRARCVVVAATSDAPAMERVCGAHTAATIAEYFRDTGRHVLLIVDSLTRFARALREVGLSTGEAAVRRGFTPSVYTELPRLIERAGRTEKGAITAIYTVLAETETEEDPIVEEVKSLTDGHLHLSPALARIGHYPAIDVLKSNSRLMGEILNEEDKARAYRARELIAKYEEISLLVQVGEYKRGFDALGDAALDHKAALEAFLRQKSDLRCARAETRAALAAALA